VLGHFFKPHPVYLSPRNATRSRNGNTVSLYAWLVHTSVEVDGVIFVCVQDVTLLLMGGLMMALAVEKCQLHARIALKILLFFGTKPSQ